MAFTISCEVSGFLGHPGVYGAKFEQSPRIGNGIFAKDGDLSGEEGANKKKSPALRIALAKSEPLSTNSQKPVTGSMQMSTLSGGLITIPLNYFQILGLHQGATEKQILAAYEKLRKSTIDESYTVTAVFSRQELLEEAKTKAVMEGKRPNNDAKPTVKWKQSSATLISVPLGWLPGVLALLQQVGEDDLVIKVGTEALNEKKTSFYHNDIMLAVALSKCSKAKRFFERSSFSDGFEELVEAHMLLKGGKGYLRHTKLIAQIEASLEEMAPACTLERLSLPRTENNKEIRSNALAALQQLIQQGLQADPSCSIKDWDNFLTRAMAKLTTEEICRLLSWNSLFLNRIRNAKETMHQRVVFNSDCLYTALLAHIALGFCNRQPSVIEEAEALANLLSEADGVDRRLERAVCAALLGQADKAFRCLKETRSDSNTPHDPAREALKIISDNGGKLRGLCSFTETWLRDRVLRHFQDTRTFKASLSGYYSDPKVESYIKERGGLKLSRTGNQPFTLHLDSSPGGYLQNIPTQDIPKPDGHWKTIFTKLLVAGVFVFTSALALHLHTHDKECYCNKLSSKVILTMRESALKLRDIRSNVRSDIRIRKPMNTREAEILVRHWQAVKAVALGRYHARHCLPDILADSMLAEWQALVDKAKASSSYWRFLLLRLTVINANIITDELNRETAEVEVLIEEAAELIQLLNSKPAHSNYHSTYIAKYQLRRASDNNWRISRGRIETLS